MSGNRPRQVREFARRLTAAHGTEFTAPAGDRDEQMLQRLLDAVRRAGRVETDDIIEQVSRRDLAWMLSEPATALELLTARYATGEDRWRWDRQIRPMAPAVVVSAALAGPGIDQAAAAAVLELLPALRADLAGIERDALAAAHRTHVPADVIAAAEQRPGAPGEHR